MPAFAPYFELRAHGETRPAVERGKFIAVVEPMHIAADGDLLGVLSGDHVVVVEAPAHLQPADAGTARNDGRRAFRVAAFLRPLPPEDDADAELIVPLFSHN